jgi:two-component system, chemotaxis family, sensor kinase CheA
MSIQIDDSIREDYLNEAGELVEQLGEQLVELERKPRDKDLLNKVFRAFHTVKGGAGFLDVGALVDLCHCAEEVFDALRRNELELRTDIMDSVLHALDQVNVMLDTMRAHQDPQPAPPALLDQLRSFVSGAVQEAADASEPPDAAGDVTDEEFEAMLADVAGGSEAEDKVSDGEDAAIQSGRDESSADEITDEEFEKLLDEIHGDGGEAVERQPAPENVDVGVGSSRQGDDEEITEEEFERILDEVAASNQDRCRAAEPAAPAQTDAATDSEPDSDIQQPPSELASVQNESVERRSASVADSTIRVDVSRLDRVMNLVGELVLVRNRLNNLGLQLKDEALQSAVANLDLVTSDLQMGVMQTRMQPIRKVFSRFPRLARDLARSLEKDIELTMHGEDTDLDKNLVEALADPLVHLVRNAMDHGIEAPEVRARAGKPRTGRVELGAAQEGDHIVITISDDGAGIDAEGLRKKAVERGLIGEELASRLSRKECFDLMMLPGLSSRDEVSNISGRGVGMDVVKTRIGELNGNIEIDSERGVGTTLKVQVPLTLAILPALMVRLGQRRFAFPLSHVVEVFFLESEAVRQVEGRDVIMVRGKPLPLVFLSRFMGLEEQAEEREGYVVVLQVGSDKIGFVTNDVLGQEEVVIKPLGALLQGATGFAGATITGDGHIALIIDINGLMRRFGEAGRRG